MTNSEHSPSDDELIRRVRDAFDRQVIPKCPPINVSLDRSARNQAALLHPVLFPFAGRAAQLLASLAVLIVMTIVAITVLNSRVDHKTSELPPDEIIESVEIVATQADPRSQQLLVLIDAANDLLAGRSNNPDPLIDQWSEVYSLDRAGLKTALETVGVPSGIKYSSADLDDGRRWLRGGDQLAFTYAFNYPQVMDELTHAIDAYLGDKIVQEILDGVRDDANGPKIDLRNDFFPQLDGEIILLVSKTVEPLQDPLTIALPVKDEEKIRALVRQAHRFEPQSSSEMYGDVEVHFVVRQKVRRKAWCVVGNHLVVGDWKSVQAAVDRLKDG